MVQINRVAKVVKGGRRFSFSALVVVGNEVDTVGVGYGKANEVPLAIQKAVDDAKKNLFRVPKHRSTITHQVLGPLGRGPRAAEAGLRGYRRHRRRRRARGPGAGRDPRHPDQVARHHATRSTSSPRRWPGCKSLRRPEEIARLRGKTVAEVLGLDGRPGPATEAVGPRRPERRR